MARILLLAAALLLLPLATPAAASDAPGWHYVLRFDETLSTVDVTCCFHRYRPKRLVASEAGVLDAITFPAAEGEARLTRRASDDSVLPAGLGPGRMCVRWRVDLDRAARVSRVVRRVGDDVVIAPGAVLLRPYLWPLAGRVSVRLVLPEGLRAIVPWQATHEADTWLLDPQSTNLTGRFAVGRFDVQRARVADADVRIVILDRPLQASPEGVARWVHAAVGAVAGLFGRFPKDSLAVMVQATPGRHPPVSFGMSMRAGGGHVLLYPAAAAPEANLPGEWVAVHELMHLGMPWTADADVWLQEGFVTYYQEVLRARAGMITPQQAWQNIEDGFGRGRRCRSGGVLAETCRRMHQDHAYHRVYWAGAAMALRIDVALRRSSGGRVSLDDVVRWWLRHRGGTVKAYGGVELLQDAERALGHPVASPIARRLLAQDTFPAVDDLYAALGVRVDEGRVTLDDTAPLAAQRRAIMRSAPR